MGKNTFDYGSLELVQLDKIGKTFTAGKKIGELHTIPSGSEFLLSSRIHQDTASRIHQGTIQVLRHHVFDFFRPTHPPL